MGRRVVLSVVVLASIVAAGCSRKVDDATLATQIKSQMFSDAQLNGANLEVTSKDGQVTLAGTVPNDAARYKAYKIANETPGVTKVNDQITVAPPPMHERTLQGNSAAPKSNISKNVPNKMAIPLAGAVRLSPRHGRISLHGSNAAASHCVVID